MQIRLFSGAHSMKILSKPVSPFSIWFDSPQEVIDYEDEEDF